MNFKRSTLLTVALIVLNLSMSEVYAASLSVKCLVFSGGSRSKVFVRGTGLKGHYYVKVFSGDADVLSGEKSTDSKGNVSFLFDSDPEVISTNPSATLIPPDLIKNKKVVGVIRKAFSHARIGGVIETCLPR